MCDIRYLISFAKFYRAIKLVRVIESLKYYFRCERMNEILLHKLRPSTMLIRLTWLHSLRFNASFVYNQNSFRTNNLLQNGCNPFFFLNLFFLYF